MFPHSGRAFAWIIAIFAMLAARDPATNVAGPTPTETSSVLPSSLDEARRLLEQGKALEAEVMARQLLEKAEREHGPQSIQTAEALDVLVLALWRGGKSKSSSTRDLAERAVSIKRNVLSAGDPRLGTSLTQLGLVLYGCGDFVQAKATHEHALAILEKSLGPNHPEVGSCLNSLAGSLFELGHYIEAREMYKRALRIHEESLGHDAPDVALDLNSLGVVLYFIGDYVAAKPCFTRALRIRETCYGPDHPLVAGVLNNLGNLQKETGDYAGARLSCERALRIREKSLGPNHPLLASSLNNLARLLAATGDYAAAKALYLRAAAINEAANGADHPHTALALGNLAELLCAMGDGAGARPLYERALHIEEKALGPDHSEVASTLAALGNLLVDQGDWLAARGVYERSLRIQKQALGTDHPEVARIEVHLANVLHSIGSDARAHQLYIQALAAQEKALGNHHPEVATTLIGMASLLAEIGRPHEAFETALRAEAISAEHLKLTARTLAERQALRYDAVRMSGLGLALDLLVREASPPPLRRRQAWEALIRSRAMVLDEIASRNRAAEGARDPEVAKLVVHLTAARTRLANLTVRGGEDLDPQTYRALLDQAREEKESAERDLALRSFWFRQEQSRAQTGLPEVAKNLPPGAALVAFASYPSVPRLGANAAPAGPVNTGSYPSLLPAPSGKSLSYLAFVLRVNRHVDVIPLGPASDIDRLVASWSSEIAAGARQGGSPKAVATYRSAGEVLRRKVWDPIEPSLASARQVFLVPDGALHLLSFAALPVGTQEFLIQRPVSIHYLSTERDLVRLLRKDGVSRGLLAMGGPDFNSSIAASAAHATPEDSVDGRAGNRSRGVQLPLPPLPPLPASLLEVQEIAALWDRARLADAVVGRHGDAPRAQSEVLCLTGVRATEAAFKELAPGRRVLHLATHGFFLTARSGPPAAVSRGIGSSLPMNAVPVATSEYQDPLLRAGLVFAGANRHSDASSEVDDGVLTAEEIAGLNLGDVEWAVLSACDTGVGEVRTSEGVFGLRRAFQIAGVRTLVMSLWSVQDELAREWMGALYRGRFVGKLSTIDAARQASLEVLNQRRALGQSTHPVYWAGFIAVGDWD